jgi:uncharacterized repeat protein (TIGR01451 family)
MEEVRRVTTTRKANKKTTILLVLSGILGVALIGAAIYFYAIGDISQRDSSKEITCACYYIDPAVIRECGDPRKGFLFELATTTGDQLCRAACSTSKLSVNLLNSSTKQDLYQICQLQVVQDARCREMVVKDKDGKIVTGIVNADDQITVEAKFDKEYSQYKFIINNEEAEPDNISSDKLTIKKSINDLGTASSLNIEAIAMSGQDEVKSPLCRRLISINREGTSSVNDIRVQTRKDGSVYKVSTVKISIGNVSEDKNLTIKFLFTGKNLTDLLMAEGFTIDSAKGEVTILEQDLYNSENFDGDVTFAQLNGIEGEVEIKAELRDDTGLIGTVSGSLTFPKSDATSEETTGDTSEESNFEVTKGGDKECVERIAPNNVAQFTLTVKNNSSITQGISSVKDKLPLGFTYVQSSTRINGVSVSDADYVAVQNVGDTQEIVWKKSDTWSVNAGQTLTILFKAEAGANALTGSNQNEVIITPVEVPGDPTSLRAEYALLVAQDCDNPDLEPTTPTTPPTQQPTTTPTTGIFDYVVVKLIVGLITLVLGWYIYSKPMGKLLIEKLVESGLYKEAEIATWKIFRPRKHFEVKLLRKLKIQKRNKL